MMVISNMAALKSTKHGTPTKSKFKPDKLDCDHANDTITTCIVKAKILLKCLTKEVESDPLQDEWGFHLTNLRTLLQGKNINVPFVEQRNDLTNYMIMLYNFADLTQMVRLSNQAVLKCT